MPKGREAPCRCLSLVRSHQQGVFHESSARFQPTVSRLVLKNEQFGYEELTNSVIDWRLDITEFIPAPTPSKTGFGTLKALLQQPKSSDIVVIAGDLNAQVGRLSVSETQLRGRHGLDSIKVVTRPLTVCVDGLFVIWKSGEVTQSTFDPLNSLNISIMLSMEDKTDMTSSPQHRANGTLHKHIWTASCRCDIDGLFVIWKSGEVTQSTFDPLNSLNISIMLSMEDKTDMTSSPQHRANGTFASTFGQLRADVI
ncbi:hypothetical protein CLF_104604 [Clonorchis sinensis]|uniref:Endonuclease/exonuclease/phosphatase domain-containing protein n=1 Tax=Clonorchis sinensis TaxID=79923 RepID=G7YC02_CLOSI|nr:hypothetical protein CLF_104604 [Clonorchis sinensis]